MARPSDAAKDRELIRILTGQEVPSRGIPAQIGIVCQNIATVAAIADAAFDGKPLISRIVTLTGRGVGQPRNLEVPIGVPIRDLIEQAGKIDMDDVRAKSAEAEAKAGSADAE